VEQETLYPQQDVENVIIVISGLKTELLVSKKHKIAILKF